MEEPRLRFPGQLQYIARTERDSLLTQDNPETCGGLPRPFPIPQRRRKARSLVTRPAGLGIGSGICVRYPPRGCLSSASGPRETFLFAIHFQNHDFQGLTDMEHFARMVHAAPAHIRDMGRPSHAAECRHKSAEVRDILHDTFHLVAFPRRFSRKRWRWSARWLQSPSRRKGRYFTVVIYLDDLEFNKPFQHTRSGREEE